MSDGAAVRIAVNDLAPRAAMGLPAYLVDRSPLPCPADPALGTLDPDALAAIAEDGGAPFDRRLAAGALLGIVGDPRIRPLDPAMRMVPAGEYEIGLDVAAVDEVAAEFARHGVLRAWIEKEVPAHRVWLERFAIGTYPVTNIEYALFLRETRALPLPASWPLGVPPLGHGNHPVHGVTPEAADAYAAWLGACTGRRFRLPGEAEWEAAAGGHVYPWGDRFAPDRANTVEAGIHSTTPVGVFPLGRSAFGCLDLAGNVEEYVADSYRPYPGGRIVRDDLLRSGAGYRVARGGSHSRFRDLARCRRRHGWFDSPLYVMGFRLAETLPEAGGRGRDCRAAP